jgi:hypothetical protein
VTQHHLDDDPIKFESGSWSRFLFEHDPFFRNRILVTVITLRHPATE